MNVEAVCSDLLSKIYPASTMTAPRCFSSRGTLPRLHEHGPGIDTEHNCGSNANKTHLLSLVGSTLKCTLLVNTATACCHGWSHGTN